MALTGTLKDFGIADILQLIGQQQKTGVLYLKSKEQEVQVFFRDGNIVRAESVTRKKKDLIGNMLVRAELITEQQLESALETQKRTLKRVGDVLISTGAISAQKLKQMMQLQVTESLYGLFLWKAGTYEFKQEEVQADSESITPLRAESVLMEGFRMVDEWPHVRKKISSEAMTFERLKELPAPNPKNKKQEEDDFDAAFDDAFSEEKKDENKGEFKSIGSAERRVYELVAPGRDLRKLVDLSCMGEFETSKALVNLLNLEYIRAHHASGRASSVGAANLLVRVGGVVARAVVTVVVLAALGFVGSRLRPDTWDLGDDSASSFADPAAQRLLARAQRGRIEAALEVFRLEKGALPERLDVLVEVGLLQQEDLRYPWREDYYYRRTSDRQFILLSPLR
ncbi:DUF4388 domain-containing protein [Archangium violaceum]|uniref:PatA-like N-terminal domain-containing protein n=1 Tax=Archangium violaceum Cb vi76 TaxID=1406225 RepID=A0A084SI73_9BACT|nr:DUF4388 domain-containing protein [Archangium violaceum]KFA88158.1 hypothetical protein Q664_42995 [Archangium violaceum Cb vi76]